MSFADLPLEIVEIIVSHLVDPPEVVEWQGRYKTRPFPGPLYCLCLTNRALNDLATPLLYGYWTTGNESGLGQFVAQILASEEHLNNVKHVMLNDWAAIENDGGHVWMEPHIRKTLNDALRPWVKPFHECLERYVRGPADPVYAGLLSILPNVEELYLSVPYSDEPTFVELLLRRCALDFTNLGLTDPKLPFQHLRHVYVQWWDVEDLLDGQFLIPLFQLPAIRSIHGFRIGSFEISSYPSTEELPRRISPVDELTLEYSDLDDRTVISFVEACRTLRRLKLHWDSIEDIEEVFNLAIIAKSILAYKEHLEELSIDVSGSRFAQQDGTPEWEIGDLLAGLTNLKKLDIDMSILFDGTRRPLAETLPQSLKSLTVRVWPDTDDFVKGLLLDALGGLLSERYQSGRFASLSTIDLSSWLSRHSDMSKVMRSICNTLGVDLKLSNSAAPYKLSF